MNSQDLQLGVLINSDIFVKGLCSALQSHAPGTIHVRVLTPSVADREIGRGAIDILILDSQLTASVAHTLGHKEKRPKVIVVSEKPHPGMNLPIHRERICGFFSARSSEWKLKGLLDSVLECHIQPQLPPHCSECPLATTLAPRSLPLSRRENEIFQYLGSLHSTSDIADQLNISIKTVEAHCTNIKRKLGLANSRELLKEAVLWVEGQ